MATGWMVQSISKLPFLNIMIDVLLMHVPSGKMSIGSFLSSTCFFSLQQNVPYVTTNIYTRIFLIFYLFMERSSPTKFYT